MPLGVASQKMLAKDKCPLPDTFQSSCKAGLNRSYLLHRMEGLLLHILKSGGARWVF